MHFKKLLDKLMEIWCKHNINTFLQRGSTALTINVPEILWKIHTYLNLVYLFTYLARFDVSFDCKKSIIIQDQ